MAVAADFHRNFLIPGHKAMSDNRCKMHPMICVYSFVEDIITQGFQNFNIIQSTLLRQSPILQGPQIC